MWTNLRTWGLPSEFGDAVVKDVMALSLEEFKKQIELEIELVDAVENNRVM
jgi:hypothetical protein